MPVSSLWPPEYARQKLESKKSYISLKQPRFSWIQLIVTCEGLLQYYGVVGKGGIVAKL